MTPNNPDGKYYRVHLDDLENFKGRIFYYEDGWFSLAAAATESKPLRLRFPYLDADVKPPLFEQVTKDGDPVCHMMIGEHDLEYHYITLPQLEEKLQWMLADLAKASSIYKHPLMSSLVPYLQLRDTMQELEGLKSLLQIRDPENILRLMPQILKALYPSLKRNYRQHLEPIIEFLSQPDVMQRFRECTADAIKQSFSVTHIQDEAKAVPRHFISNKGFDEAKSLDVTFKGQKYREIENSAGTYRVFVPEGGIVIEAGEDIVVKKDELDIIILGSADGQNFHTIEPYTESVQVEKELIIQLDSLEEILNKTGRACDSEDCFNAAADLSNLGYLNALRLSYKDSNKEISLGELMGYFSTIGRGSFIGVCKSLKTNVRFYETFRGIVHSLTIGIDDFEIPLKFLGEVLIKTGEQYSVQSLKYVGRDFKDKGTNKVSIQGLGLCAELGLNPVNFEKLSVEHTVSYSKLIEVLERGLTYSIKAAEALKYHPDMVDYLHQCVLEKNDFPVNMGSVSSALIETGEECDCPTLKVAGEQLALGTNHRNNLYNFLLADKLILGGRFEYSSLMKFLKLKGNQSEYGVFFNAAVLFENNPLIRETFRHNAAKTSLNDDNS